MKPATFIDADQEKRKQLIAEGFHRGERWAFDALAREHFAHITNFIAHLLGNRDRAVELAQESFFLACRSHQRFDPSRDVLPWLFQIARNVAYKEFNRRKNRPEVSLEQTMEDSHYEPQDDSADPRQAIADEETMQRIENALQKMKPKYRDVLILRMIQGLPSERVSELLDIPVATVNTHTHRALKTLRRLAQQEGLREDEVFL